MLGGDVLVIIEFFTKYMKRDCLYMFLKSNAVLATHIDIVLKES
ncbi:MAG: hypothetical protein UW81_C0006G0019 [Candidatus Giovannonibacteria bacterium GW2011_GWC2_44_9]|uniref:Uncharacterized protein n=3 Tax=Candidatus Giovannoniibacteriota TaxID=1752738 RepID=A0A0G1IY88_9BACT|nr:MAG: hypothetical protein UW49_C0004G0064 [Candidatus Giovannonibacteria bacterium GW2011_GWB1_44_23]KKT63953.1 MAG: hypothetical protein UW57_C0004G0063 [Candidatus Giovannonibacteria bacterium GW2011_GWA1_44_29]KKT84094.1 MAG: hypothetical protein UW81_C0006G0019 [Candidatus Giovannonibacteria bacterium GW2011_GWC2_44_9]KKT91666.1 MAG: hypothetical protein UW93_C0004G0064 [Parcubacteria group bacterium GW2011_GWC1_45_13]